MKRLNGFSLMEMMIVLTIVAIVAAASAPMVNKKMVRAASEKSPWIWVNGNEFSIAYNTEPNNANNKTASIGTQTPPNNLRPRLYIDSTSDNNPHIMFGNNRNSLMRLIAGGERSNTWLSNNAPSDAAIASVSLGWNSNAPSNRSVAVGMNSNAESTATIAIGNRANARANVAVAIGDGAEAGFEGGEDANKFSAIAIGSESRATRTRTIAIGRHAEATAGRAIAIGSSGDDSAATRARAQGASSIAIGGSALARNENAIALGGTATASGITIGSGSNSGVSSIAIGNNVNTSLAAAPSTSITIGDNSNSEAARTTVVGASARATQRCGTAIGSDAQATGQWATALGFSANASNQSSVAIGDNSGASGRRAIAIGQGASATAMNSIAIGIGAVANKPNRIVLGGPNSVVVFSGNIQLGSATSTVYIPGNLVVDRNVYLNRSWNGSNNVRTYLGIYRKNSTSDGKGLTALSYRRVADRDGVVQHDTDIRTSQVPLPAVFTSDRRLKNVGKEFKAGLTELKKLEVFNYTLKNDKDKTPRVGVMAQDLQKIFPDAVVKGEDGFLRIRMEDMFYAVINAVKELDVRVSSQDKRIEELERQNKELLKRLEALEKAKK